MSFAAKISRADNDFAADRVVTGLAPAEHVHTEWHGDKYD
jgi:hypothetical protein